MSWLQKRPQASDSIQLYTVGLAKSILLVGLGNPGKEYDNTRHNIGFACLDAFVAADSGMENWINKKDLKCFLSNGRIGDSRIYAIKPTTFMNLSGEAVHAVMQFYKIPTTHVVVVHDELDIDFGQIRMRQGGSSAGHNGIKSVTEHIGEGYGRIRIGIGPKHPARMVTEKFVLQTFSDDEQAELGNLAKEAGAILSEYVYSTELPNETRSFIF